MRIGLDLDDTICSTKEMIKKYADIYCEDNKIDVDTLWKDNNYRVDFLTRYLQEIYSHVQIKNNAKQVINKLKSMNNKIYIITARSNNFVNVDMKEFISNYLRKNEIVIDDIIINAKDKVEACKNLKIDIMLEDSLYNYNSLIDSGVNAILYDELNIHKDITNRITNWEEILKKCN